MTIDALRESASHFSLGEVLLLVLSTTLLILARFILEKVFRRDLEQGALRVRVAILRVINLLVIALLLTQNVYVALDESPWAARILGVLVVIYTAYLAFHVAVYFVNRRFGQRLEVNGDEIAADTYNSRALALLCGLLLAIAALISIIQILEFDSLLEGGVLGFIGVMLALTQGAWAPDIISGLVILNSGFIREGDVVQVDEGHSTFVGSVFRIKMFHTEFLNLVNNHRIMVKNSRLREFDLHNLTRFASAKGLRERLLFNIGYDVAPDRVREMFGVAFERAAADSGLEFAPQFGWRAAIHETGDYAITWSFFYHTKNVRQMIVTRQRMRELILNASVEFGVSLATPALRHVEMTESAPPHSV